MRIARLIIGALVVIGALYLLVGEQLRGSSANAVLNARLTTLRATIAGDLSLEERVLGALVAENETLGSITDPLVDTVRLDDLRLEIANARAELLRAEDRALANDAAIASLEERSREYTNERIHQLKARITAAESRAGAYQARLEEAEAALARSEQLQARGVETEASGERAFAAREVAARELQAARDEVAGLEVALSAGRRGITLADGANEMPYSRQRIAELSLENEDLTTRAAELESRIAALRDRADAERVRANRLTSAAIHANVRGRVWQYLTADGERVLRGQDLLRLVDCDSLMVTLSVAETIYNQLRIGDAAEFRPMGDGHVFPATITRLAGAGAETIYANLAVAPSEAHLDRYDVTLAVPSLNDHPQLGCAIGRTGRAFFGTRPLDRVRDLF